MTTIIRLLLALVTVTAALTLAPGAASADMPQPGAITVHVDQVGSVGQPFDITLTSGWPQTTGTQNLQLTDTGSWWGNAGKFKGLAPEWQLISQTPDPRFHTEVFCDTNEYAEVWVGSVTEPNEKWILLHDGGAAECWFVNTEIPVANPSWSTPMPQNYPGAPSYTWWNTDVTVDWNWSAYSAEAVANCEPSTTSTKEGVHNVTATCTHAYTNATITAAKNVRVDKTPDPAPTITQVITQGAYAEFHFTPVPDYLSGVHRFQCQLDNGGWHYECQNPAIHNLIGPGNHTFRVRVVDNAGNIGETTAYTWTP